MCVCLSVCLSVCLCPCLYVTDRLSVWFQSLTTAMDPFSQRLRKQRERSSLRARQLNKNALTMLQKQLRVLERREHQNARALVRTKQSILEELEAFQDLEYDALEPRPRTTPPQHPRTLPPLGGFFRKPPDLGSPPGVSSHGQNSSENRPSAAANSAEYSLSNAQSNFSWASSSLDPAAEAVTLPASFRRHHDHAAKGGDCHHSASACRFGALSPLSPCRHFPCSTPRSYHHLLTNIPDPALLALAEAHGQPTPVESTRSHPPAALLSSTSTSCLSDLQVSRSTFSPFSLLGSAAAAEGGKASVGSGSAVSQIRRQRDGHISPRTSIQERLRGLRQLVRELREKNERKKPRDWAVNYGDAVSRRLLRKPVIPVSEKAL